MRTDLDKDSPKQCGSPWCVWEGYMSETLGDISRPPPWSQSHKCAPPHLLIEEPSAGEGLKQGYSLQGTAGIPFWKPIISTVL